MESSMIENWTCDSNIKKEHLDSCKRWMSEMYSREKTEISCELRSALKELDDMIWQDPEFRENINYSISDSCAYVSQKTFNDIMIKIYYLPITQSHKDYLSYKIDY